MKRCSVALLLLVAACRTHQPVVAAAPQPAPGAPVDNSRGNVAAKLLEDHEAPAARLGPGEEYRQPEIMTGNPMPEYPADLVKLHLPPQEVVVRMLVDESRHISLSDSPVRGSSEGPYRARFEESVWTTLQKWDVWPPSIRKYRPGPDLDGDGKPDYQILADQKTLKVYFDFAFTFEVVNGQGVVRSAQAAH